MIYQNVEFHNIAEACPVPGKRGVRLQRVPESVRHYLTRHAEERMLSPAGAEIRFVSQGRSVHLVLSCPEGEAEAMVFYGPFQSYQRFAIRGSCQEVEVTRPPELDFLANTHKGNFSFDPSVCRVLLAGSPVFFNHIRGEGIRPPLAGELPSLRYLAYGTSITHGISAGGAHLTYPMQVGRRLGADVINLGVSGAAMCEPALADYIAERRDWDVATLALSVNMIYFGLDDFYRRIQYMIDRVAGADPSRPVACITIYPHAGEWGDPRMRANSAGETEDYRQALREAVERSPHPNLHLIEGPDLLADIGGLRTDLIHPGDDGMIMIAENLARRLAPLFRKRLESAEAMW